jgi:hypothetical protein
MFMPGGGTEKSIVSKIFFEYSRLSEVMTAMLPGGGGAETSGRLSPGAPIEEGVPETIIG